MSQEIPRGVEVLVTKAAVDPAFKDVLLERRARAAELIGLELDPNEALMLAAVPAAQLEAIIGRTTVAQEHRRTFLGQAAAAMLAALGVTAGAAAGVKSPEPGGGAVVGGVRPDQGASFGNRPAPPPPAPTGIRPDPVKPEPRPVENVSERVMKILARRLRVGEDKLQREALLVKDLKATIPTLVRLRKELEQEFGITIPGKTFGKLGTVGQLIDHVEEAVQNRPGVPARPGGVEPPPPTRGIQSDRPAMQIGGGGARPDQPPAAGRGGTRP